MTDLNNLGTYTSIKAVWEAYPNGGKEGDYLYIGKVKYSWNKYERIWENSENITQAPGRENTNFDGDVTVQNNLTVAGTLRAKRVKQPNCGLFPTLEALKKRYPNPEVGMWAAVGNTTPADIYRCDVEGVWKATGEKGGVDNIDLDKYDTAIEELEQTHEKDVTELRNAVFPLALTFSVTPLLVEVSKTSALTFRWNVKRKGVDVTSSSTKTLNDDDVTGTSTTVSVSPTSETTYSYTLKASYQGISAQQTLQVKAVYKSYFGVVKKSFEPSETSILSLSGSLNGNKALSKAGLSFADSKLCYAYPASFGKLTSIKDGNGYEVLSSYTQTEVSVNGISYYCYVLTNEVSASGVTQNYQ
ncbi:MAG: hypothetical protein IJY60_05265 [Bacteroides sp.]|nr:hypothetical protein [Bacteroides sp.]